MKSITQRVRELFTFLLTGVFVVACFGAGPSLFAGPGLGRAVVANVSGSATLVYPDKTAHDYPQGHGKVVPGMSLSELHIIQTAKDGRLCLVLTPGAFLCVNPNTSIKLEKLENRTQGIPETGKDLIRWIEVTVQGGGIYVHAGTPTPLMNIKINTPVGEVFANGGDFVVMKNGEDWNVASTRSSVTFTRDRQPTTMPEGWAFNVSPSAGSAPKQLPVPAEELSSRFTVCKEFFPDLEPYVFNTSGVDMQGVKTWVDVPQLTDVGDAAVWSDVTPSQPVKEAVSVSSMPASSAAAGGGRWGEEKAWQWYSQAGTTRGVNYVPSYAVNSVEFWQAETFDPKLISKELAWAADSGFNSVRIPLQYKVWEADPKGFKNRVKEFVSLAKEHHLTVVPVLFDDMNVAGTDPTLGHQPDPVPGVNNSQWVSSPGAVAVTNRNVWDSLNAYVYDVVGAFRQDKQILFWDLYNTPGNGGLGEKSLALLDSTFTWAREMKPRQPLAVGVWADADNLMAARIIELSDIINFQSFGDAEQTRAKIALCEPYNRPILCTDWLMRQEGNSFKDILPVFQDKRVGWYSRGLVQGRSQLFVPEGGVAEIQPKGGSGTGLKPGQVRFDQGVVDMRKQFKAGEKRGEIQPAKPGIWQSDLLHSDGKPYDRSELDLIKRFRFTSG